MFSASKEVIKHGLPVHVFNQRSVAGILEMIRVVGALVDASDRAAALIAELQSTLDRLKAEAASLPRRPVVYFEEWHEPMISGIRWASELIELAGGRDAFPELAEHANAGGRIINDPLEVVRRAPDIIIGSWCGRKFQPDAVAARPGWDAIPAVRNHQLIEMKSAVILTPGPVAIAEGLPDLARIIRNWAEKA